MIKYGLREKSTGRLLGFEVSSNGDAEFSGATSTTLYPISETEDYPLWMVNSVDEAKFVRDNSTGWYNAGHTTPEHGFKWQWGDLEIVVFEIAVHVKSMDEYSD